jgi:uncharacterized alpha-E superfamily protein
MLARVAENLYWSARDIERAATVARALEVCHAASLEGPLQNGAGSVAVWEPVIRIVGDPAVFAVDHRRTDERSVSWYLTLSTANPNSIVACLGRARDRIRAIRAGLPTELFEAINSGAIMGRAWDARRLTHEGLFSFCHQVRGHIAAVDGIVDRSVRRDEQWQFLRVGRHLERAIQVTRLLAAHTDAREAHDAAGGIGDWRTALKFAASYEAYIRVGLPGREPSTPEAFLLMDRHLPSSVTYCLGEVSDALDTLRAFASAIVDVPPKASVSAAARAAASAAQFGSAQYGFDKLEVRLAEIHDAISSIFLPDAEFTGGPIYAQAVRQAQN